MKNQREIQAAGLVATCPAISKQCCSTSRTIRKLVGSQGPWTRDENNFNIHTHKKLKGNRFLGNDDDENANRV